MAFKFKTFDIKDLILVEAEILNDTRGFFHENYKRSSFQKNGIPIDFVQENRSFSNKNVLRGLHYQIEPHAQGKLVECLQGEIFDVAVDIRRSSPTFGKWAHVTLSDKQKTQFYIPPGFAHGFCVLSEQAYISYKCTAEYDPSSERSLLWNDPDINIAWPIKNPILSEKDARNPLLKTIYA